MYPYTICLLTIHVHVHVLGQAYLPLEPLLILEGDGLARSGTWLATISSYS